MGSEPDTVPLAEIAELTVGGVWGEDAPTARATDAVYCLRGIDLDGLARRAGATPPQRFISSKQLASRLLEWGDIVIEASGSNCGRSMAASQAVAGLFELPLVYSNFCKRIRIRDTSQWHPLYVWRVLQSLYSSGDVQTYRTGSAVPNLDVKRLVAQLRVPARPMDEQRAIAEVVGALDDRIEWCSSTSRQMIGIADAVWGRAVADGGEPATIGEVAAFENRRRIPLSSREREARPGPFPYYGATGIFGYVDDFLFDGNYVLVGEDGSVVKEDGTAVVQYATGRFWVNNHAHVLVSDRFTAEELFLALRRTVVAGYVTGAVQPKLSMGRLKQVPVHVPSTAATEEVRPLIGALFAQHRAAANEAETLRATRDTLLPRLLSGELRIENPERLLEGVA